MRFRIGFVFLWGLFAMNTFAQPHFDGQKFFNPFPEFEERGFSDLAKWMIWERLSGQKPHLPDHYNFENARPDTAFLKKNHTTFAVTWIGHSTLLIQMDGQNILTDPIWSERASPLPFLGPKRVTPPAIPFKDLPPVDVVVISHDHYDHLDKPTILRLGNKPLYLVPLGVGAILKSWGIDHYQELDWWDEFVYNKIRFTCTPAQHFSGRTPLDRNQSLWASWVIRGNHQNIYFGGDTGYFPGFAEIANRLGPFDLAALPIGAYRPRWFMSPVHMDPAQAVQAWQDLKARIFLPIHWRTFQLADEPLDEPPQLLRRELHKHHLDKNLFWILLPGETRTLAAQTGRQKELVKVAQRKRGNRKVD